MKKKRIKPDPSPALASLVTLLILFFVVALAISNYRAYKRRVELQQYISEKEIEINLLKEKMINLDRFPDEADDDFLLEKIAREQLLLKKPGEEVIFITFPKKDDVKDEKKEEAKSWWDFFKKD
ncbi:MAG: septum formation initiator family protein [Minisyncoccales bacterium]|jgi:cell division protein FtsB